MRTLPLADREQKHWQLRVGVVIAAGVFAVWAWFEPPSSLGTAACVAFLLLYVPSDRRLYRERKERAAAQQRHAPW